MPEVLLENLTIGFIAHLIHGPLRIGPGQFGQFFEQRGPVGYKVVRRDLIKPLQETAGIRPR